MSHKSHDQQRVSEQTDQTNLSSQERAEIAVCDTNIFLKDPQALKLVQADKIIVPLSVLEELDSLKSVRGETGKNARQAIKYFDTLMKQGDLNKGIKLDSTPGAPILQVVHSNSFLPEHDSPDSSEEITDDAVMRTAFYYHNTGKKTVLCTQDINLRLKASHQGLTSKEHAARKQTNIDDSVGAVFHKKIPARMLKELTKSKVAPLVDCDKLYVNQFVVLKSENNPEHARVFRYLGGTEFTEATTKPVFGPFAAQNREQQMAFDLLLDPSVSLVSLIGIAGTGKTFMIILAALKQILHEQTYSRLMVTRPTVSLGPEIGFLPGDMDDKIATWMQPVYDNISVIINGTKSKKYPIYLTPQQLTENDQLSLEAITFMRGRSLPQQFLFVDEAQNLTPLEVKTLITRAGHGTKVVLAGDPEQIDTPRLNYEHNGLMYASRRFLGQSLFGTVTLHKSERSRLAQKAAELL